MENLTRVSAPEYLARPPRTLTDRELQAIIAIGDALIPDGPAGPRPSAVPDFPLWLNRALAARRDVFDELMSLVDRLADCPSDSLGEELRRLDAVPGSGFGPLSSVVAGAYLLSPKIRRAVGYPGQKQRTPPFDEAAEQIMSGILEPVIERGRVYRSADAADARAEEATR